MLAARAKPTLRLSGRVRSFRAAFNGIASVLRTQPNAWIHVVATIGVIVAGACFHVSTDERRWLIVSVVIVWMAEIFNTALEWLTDLASPKIHPLAEKAKDGAAGAVRLVMAGSQISM